MTAYQQRAFELRKRFAVARIEHGVTMVKMAKDLDYHYAYVSQVLGGHLTSEKALRRITEYIDKLDSEYSLAA